MVVTKLVVERFGTIGIVALAALMGVSDVDPFIMGLTQTAGSATILATAATAVVVATASNNAIKGIYAYAFADRATGVRGLVVFLLLAAIGLLPLLVVAG
jgi:uncharacterized membrane protein (DUF4010 family)